MTTAIQLNAANSLGNNSGLQVSANLLAQISTLQNKQQIKTIANIYTTAATANANVAANLDVALSSVGANVKYGRWLIDFYPTNVTPVCSTSVYTYGSLTTATIDGGSIVVTTTPLANTASMSHTISNQANAPFTFGVNGFANVYNRVSAYVSSVFDIVSSVNLLKNKTYAQSGLNYSGPLDLATGGVGTTNTLIGNAVANWGTMYDINNMRYIGDPYVFGQNLLNQGLGSYGNLATSLTSVGLNIYNLPQIPPTTTATTQEVNDLSWSTSIGAVAFPMTSNVTTTTTVSGSSANVVIEIYRGITGANLKAIEQATGITSGKSITSLADYLELSKVVDGSTITQLKAMNINTLSDFGSYIQSKVGQGTFGTWNNVNKLLGNLEVPTLRYTNAGASDTVISSSVANGLLNQYGTGTGPYDTPTVIDCLGAVSGIPYTSLLQTLNTNYSTVVPSGLQSALSALDSAVTDYVAAGNSYAFDANIYPPPDIGPVTSAVNAVNSSLSTVSNTSATVNTCESAVYAMLTHLAGEVTRCQKAGVNFAAAPPSSAGYNLGQNIGSAASNKTTKKSYQFFANLITNDYAGDTVRLTIAETINTQQFGKAGITLRNDPQPQITLSRSEQLGIPLSTYLSHNK